MPVWRINVLKDGKPDSTRDIVARRTRNTAISLICCG
jgi:hypothetical protein